MNDTLSNIVNFILANKIDFVKTNDKRIIKKFQLSVNDIADIEIELLRRANIKPIKKIVSTYPGYGSLEDYMEEYRLPNGKLHRDDGPALIVKSQNRDLEREEYYINNRLHNKTRPAIIWVSGKYENEWWNFGKLLRKSKEWAKAALLDLEKQFLEKETSLDDQARIPLWIKMAELNEYLDKHNAGICWSNSIWENKEKTSLVSIGNKIRELSDFSEIKTQLANQSPTRDEIYNISFYIISAFLLGEKLDNAYALQIWVEKYKDNIDIRTLYLVIYSISSFVEKDILMLTRARDEIFTRIRNGLSYERDLPTFVRFSKNRNRNESILTSLEKLFGQYKTTKRNKKPVEAKEELTNAYVSLTFGFAYARIGFPDKARATIKEAEEKLDLKDPIHQVLFGMFKERIDQSIESKSPDHPLSFEVLTLLGSIEKFAKYKVDRFREASKILEPQTNLDPINSYQHDGKLEEIKNLSKISDQKQLAAEIKNIILQVKKENKEKIFVQIIDFFFLTGTEVKNLIGLLINNIKDVSDETKAEIYQKLIVVAGYIDQTQLVNSFIDEIKSLLKKTDKKYAIKLTHDLWKFLRSFRRLGIRHEVSSLIETLQNIIGTDQTPENMIVRANICACLIYLGDIEQTQKAKMELEKIYFNTEKIAKSFNSKDSPATSIEIYLKLHSALALALSQLPDEDFITEKFNGLMNALTNITDSYGTNTHFCRSVVQFMETLVLGYISDSLVFGKLGQKWMDEDEYIIRRRINKDVRF